MDESTKRFLDLMEKQNAFIAALEAERNPHGVGEDPIRVQRDQERREKWGELRAREHTSHRPRQAMRVFPYVDLSHE